jgi:hypothetical protein
VRASEETSNCSTRWRISSEISVGLRVCCMLAVLGKLI